MNLVVVANFLAILVIVAGVVSLGLLGLRLVATVSGAAGGLLERVRVAVEPYALWLAWLVAATAMAGSLYFSEMGGLVPCELCWYQRIAMYPLAILLLIAAIRGDWGIRPYATALAGIGACIAAYHALLQRFPTLPSGSCDPSNPCSTIDLERFGFITIPVMALTGFVTILTLLWVIGNQADVAEPKPEDTEAAP